MKGLGIPGWALQPRTAAEWGLEILSVDGPADERTLTYRVAGTDYPRYTIPLSPEDEARLPVMPPAHRPSTAGRCG